MSVIKIKVYGEEIPFYTRKQGGKIETVKDFYEFLMDNEDLIEELISYEPILLKKGEGLSFDKLFNVCKKSGKLDFYNKSIDEFKKLL